MISKAPSNCQLGPSPVQDYLPHLCSWKTEIARERELCRPILKDRKMGVKNDSKINGLPQAVNSESLFLEDSTWTPLTLCRSLLPKDNNPARTEPGRGSDSAETSLSCLFSAICVKVKSKRRGEKRHLEKSVLYCLQTSGISFGAWRARGVRPRVR